MRLEMLKQSENLNMFVGLPESIIEFEAEEGHNFGNRFTFSGFELSYYGFDIYIGKIDDYYFLGVTNPDSEVSYKYFKTKKEFEIYIATEVDKEDRYDFLSVLKTLG